MPIPELQPEIISSIIKTMITANRRAPWDNPCGQSKVLSAAKTLDQCGRQGFSFMPAISQFDLDTIVITASHNERKQQYYQQYLTQIDDNTICIWIVCIFSNTLIRTHSSRLKSSLLYRLDRLLPPAAAALPTGMISLRANSLIVDLTY